MEIDWYKAERAPLRSLFALAEDSPQRLEASIDQGRILAATDDGQIVAYLQLVESDADNEIELRSMAVVEQRQRKGARQHVGEASTGEMRSRRGSVCSGITNHWEGSPAATVQLKRR